MSTAEIRIAQQKDATSKELLKPMVPLRGIPIPHGSHIRFLEDGNVEEVSGDNRTCLRGIPPAEGKHIRFD